MIEFITQNGADLSLVIRFIALVISGFFVIPLMVQQSKVKNGLKKLRYLLLGLGLVIFVINIITMIYLLQIVVGDIPQKLLNSILQIVNALGHLTMSAIIYMMYHSQYNKEEIEAHKKISELLHKN